MSVKKVLLASPRGFCAGVEMAIKALSWMVKVFEPPIYCYHEIVHNQAVVNRFKDQGVIFVNDVNDVPDFAPLMLSAHGTAPEVESAAMGHNRVVVNAVCPLVTKVHHEVRVRAKKGFKIIYVGHRGHEEAIGTIAVAPESVHLVERPEDLEYYDFSKNEVALLAQTTLSQYEWDDVLFAAKQIKPNIWMPSRGDLCFATTNRQSALKEIAKVADVVIVVGSANSSNTVALTKVAKANGCNRVIRINNASELPNDIEGLVGLTAGASAPEELVMETIKALNPVDGVEEVLVTQEDEYFPPPPELRELLKSMTLALSVGLNVSTEPMSPLKNDRSNPATTALKTLK